MVARFAFTLLLAVSLLFSFSPKAQAGFFEDAGRIADKYTMKIADDCEKLLSKVEAYSPRQMTFDFIDFAAIKLTQGLMTKEQWNAQIFWTQNLIGKYEFYIDATDEEKSAYEAKKAEFAAYQVDSPSTRYVFLQTRAQLFLADGTLVWIPAYSILKVDANLVSEVIP